MLKEVCYIHNLNFRFLYTVPMDEIEKIYIVFSLAFQRETNHMKSSCATDNTGHR